MMMMAKILAIMGGPATLTPMLAALAAGSAMAGFAGWKVRDWQCDAAQTKAAEVTLENAVEAQEAVNEEAQTYEATRAVANAAGRQAEVEVRYIYESLPAVAADCEPPADAQRLLTEAVARANARASGEPIPTVP